MWYAFENQLVLPEFIVDFEYITKLKAFGGYHEVEKVGWGAAGQCMAEWWAAEQLVVGERAVGNRARGNVSKIVS